MAEHFKLPCRWDGLRSASAILSGRSEHGHFIINHSINPRHDQGGVQCDGEVSRMGYVKLVASVIFLAGVSTGKVLTDSQLMMVAILLAGFIAHGEE